LGHFAGRDALRSLPNAQPPRILYPPDGAQIEVTGETGQIRPPPLEADSGKAPYRWSVNGLPLPASRSPTRPVNMQAR
jgi:hypothetical protein